MDRSIRSRLTGLLVAVPCLIALIHLTIRHGHLRAVIEYDRISCTYGLIVLGLSLVIGWEAVFHNNGWLLGEFALNGLLSSHGRLIEGFSDIP